MKYGVAQGGSYGPDATPYDLGDNPIRSQFDYTIENGQRTHLEETFYFDDDGLSTTPDVAKTTTYDWDYDANDRLISETIDHHDDALDRTEHFVMDLFGNRLSRTVDYVDPTINDQFFEYTYDDNDRFISETLDTGNDGTVDQTTTYDWGQDDTVTPALLGGTQQLGKTVQDSSGNTVSTHTFSYNLQGRLASVVSTPSSGSATKVDYQYDSSGIRISSKQFTDSNANGQFEAGELDETVEYLVDHRNHTGYAQTIVETTKDSSDVITKRIAYTFGTDEITQTVTDYIAGVAQTPKVHTFGHDAHGSVRVLLDAAGAIAQAYTYAAYGELLAIHNATGASVTDANAPGLADDAKTSLLYSGEAFDSRIGQQYLRARWYDTAAGRFSRLDPYAGSSQDPLSFNKYLYTHSNPIFGIDPTGRSLLGTTVRLAAFSAGLTAIGGAAVLGFVSHNVARDANHLPDGIVVTLSGGVATRGFQGAVGLGIYAEVSTGNIYWFHSFTAGTAPLSAFKSHRPSGSISFDVGFSWNTDSAQNLAGYSSTIALPVFLLHRLSKFKRGVTSVTDWETFMLTLAQYSKGSNIVNRRHGALSLTQSIGNGAAVTSFAFRSYNYAWTFSRASDLKPLVNLNTFGEEVGEFIGELKGKLAALTGQDLTPQRIAALIDELDDTV